MKKLILLIIALVGYFHFIRPRELKFNHVSKLKDSAQVATAISKSKDRPVLIWFYSGRERKYENNMLPAFEEMAALKNAKLSFYAYQTGEKGDPYNQMGTQAAVYVNEQAVISERNWTDDPILNARFLFVLLRSHMYPDLITSSDFAGTPAVLTIEGLKGLFRHSSRPSVVNIFDDQCQPSISLNPDFNAFSKDYGAVADFYVIPVSDELRRMTGFYSTPTVFVIKRGEIVGYTTPTRPDIKWRYGAMLNLIYTEVMRKANAR